jgi:hypothetical protein
MLNHISCVCVCVCVCVCIISLCYVSLQQERGGLAYDYITPTIKLGPLLTYLIYLGTKSKVSRREPLACWSNDYNYIPLQKKKKKKSGGLSRYYMYLPPPPVLTPM